MRAIAFAAALALAVASCGPSATEAKAGRNYTVEELGETLRGLGMCENDDFEVWQSENPYFPTVRHTGCINDDMPGGELVASTFPSSQQRLLWTIGLFALGCPSDSNFVTYVFDDEWHIVPADTLEKSDTSRVDKIMDNIAEKTGGVANTISCPDLFERLEPFSGKLDDQKAEIAAEIVRAALREPGFDPTVLDPPSG